MSTWNLNNSSELCELQETKGVILCQSNQNWIRGGGTSLTEGHKLGIHGSRIPRLAKRVAVLVYMIISRSANVFYNGPRESISICTFVFHLIFLASEEALKNFPPET